MPNTEVKFLSSTHILTTISRALKLAGSADIAVAFWGKGAASILGLDDLPGPVRILCDASSGACNPRELRLIRELEPAVTIRTFDGLHAKVFITQHLIIVGSANASSNGLGQEGEEALNSEAAVLIEEGPVNKEARSWFNKMWEVSEPITDHLLDEIEPIWKSRRQNRPVKGASKSIWSTLVNNPAVFRDRKIRVVAYDSIDPSEEAITKYNEMKAELYHPDDLQSYQRSEVWPFYEDDGSWPISAGEYVIEYHIDQVRMKTYYQGMWCVRLQHPFFRTASNSRIIMCDRVESFEGMKLSRPEAKLLGNAIFQYVKSRNFQQDEHEDMLDVPLEEAAHKLELSAHSNRKPAGQQASNPR